MSTHRTFRTTRNFSGEEESQADVPLLADAGLISASTGISDRDSSLVSFGFLLRIGSFIGCVLGAIAPFLALGASLLIGYVCAQAHIKVSVHQPVIVFSIVWGFVVTCLVFSAQYVFYKALLRHYQAQNMSEEHRELVKLRVSLGTLTGVLIAWAITCVILGFGFWDKLVVVSGVFTAALWYCEMRLVQRSAIHDRDGEIMEV